MPKRSLPRIAEVSAGDVHFGLIITWQDGSVSAVDVAEPINTFRLYAPLRHDPALFRSVQTGEFGTDIVWTDGIDMSADTLWRLAREQAGTAMSAEQFRQWRSRQGISLTEAAAALGLSRRNGFLLRIRSEADTARSRPGNAGDRPAARPQAAPGRLIITAFAGFQ
ncbi:MAG: DUF2442 domain-containing protein [Rhodospirillales bacterium]